MLKGHPGPVWWFLQMNQIMIFPGSLVNHQVGLPSGNTSRYALGVQYHHKLLFMSTCSYLHWFKKWLTASNERFYKSLSSSHASFSELQVRFATAVFHWLPANGQIEIKFEDDALFLESLQGSYSSSCESSCAWSDLGLLQELCASGTAELVGWLWAYQIRLSQQLGSVVDKQLQVSTQLCEN